MTIRAGYHTYSWVPWMQRTGTNLGRDRIFAQIVQADFSAVECADDVASIRDPMELVLPLRKHGLTLTGLNGQVNGLPGEKEGVHHVVDVLQAIGSGLLVIFDNRRGVEHNPDNIRAFAAACDEYARYAADQGIVAVYHNHLRSLVENADEVRRFLDSVRVCRLCLDIAHLRAAGDDPLGFIPQVAAHIGHVHLKDCLMDPHTGRFREFCELGQGNASLDVGGCIDAIRGAGYEGWMVVEQDATRSTPLESARANREFLDGHGL